MAWGFAAAASASHPEAALNLADLYCAEGAPANTVGAFAVPATTHREFGVPLLDAQMRQVSNADVLAPQLDRYVPPQSAFDINRVMARFFSPGSDMTGDDLAAILSTIRRREKES